MYSNMQFDLQGKIIISVIAWFWKEFVIYESFKLPYSWSSPKIFVTVLKSSEVFGSLRVIIGSSPRSSEYLGGLSADIRNLSISLEIFVVICNYEPWDLFFLCMCSRLLSMLADYFIIHLSVHVRYSVDYPYSFQE